MQEPGFRMQASTMLLQSAPVARRPIAFSGGKAMRQASPSRPQEPIRSLPHRTVPAASSAAHQSATSDDSAPSTSCTTAGSAWGHCNHHVVHQPHAGMGSASTGPSTRHAASFDRRTALILSSSLVTSSVLAHSLGTAGAAHAEDFLQRGMSRYIKKKRLDPLDTYIPLIVEAREQLVAAEEVRTHTMLVTT